MIDSGRRWRRRHFVTLPELRQALDGSKRMERSAWTPRRPQGMRVERLCLRWWSVIRCEASPYSSVKPRRRGKPTRTRRLLFLATLPLGGALLELSASQNGSTGDSAQSDARRSHSRGGETRYAAPATPGARAARSGPPATPEAPAASEAARRGRCSFPSRALTASGRRDFMRMLRRATR